MNKERITALADFMETVPDERFDMTLYGFQPRNVRGRMNDCKTAGCIAGWTLVKFVSEMEELEEPPGPMSSAFYIAQNLLDLNTSQAESLFSGDWAVKPLGDITKEDAILHLRELGKES